MKKAVFRDPDGNETIISDTGWLRNIIVNQFETYWWQGSGDGFVDYYEDSKKTATLMIGPNVEYGLYLHFVDHISKKDLLSLYDKSKLNEVAETAEEIYASVGLFLPVETAWQAIQEFAETGNASSKICWITPDSIPDDGNW